ncbi:MAG: rod shape-determining protein [Bdellovibrionota bacterium]
MKNSNSPFIILPKKPFFNINIKDVFILDIGTNSIKIYSKNKDTIIKEASLLVSKAHSNKVLAFGNAGKTIYNKLPKDYVCSMPIQNGKVQDVRVATLLLKYTLNLATSKWNLSKGTCYCIINNNVSAKDRETINAILKNLKIGKTIFINSTDLYALTLTNNEENKERIFLLAKLGAGYSEISIIKNGVAVASKELSFTGRNLDLQIINYISTNFNMFIGEFEAQRIKEEIIKEIKEKTKEIIKEKKEEETFEVYGKDLITSYHKKFTLSTTDIHLALRESIENFASEIISFLINQDDKLKCELQTSLNTLYLVGGTSKLTNLSKALEEILEIQVIKSDKGNEEISSLINLKNILHDKELVKTLASKNAS